MHAQHKEEIAEMRAESDARHAQQMAKSKQQMDECLASVKAMLQGFHEFPSITQAMQVLKMLPFNIFPIVCLLQIHCLVPLIRCL